MPRMGLLSKANVKDDWTRRCIGFGRGVLILEGKLKNPPIPSGISGSPLLLATHRTVSVLSFLAFASCSPPSFPDG